VPTGLGALEACRRECLAPRSANAYGLSIECDDPEPDEEEFEQDGLRIFVEDVLIEPRDGRTLDVKHADGEPELVLR